jgi:sulfur-carrier protein
VTFAVPINLPTPLTIYTDGRRDVAATVADADASIDGLLGDLDRQFPGIRFRMIDELGRTRAHIKFFVNRELRRDRSANIRKGDQVMIVAAISGG